MQKAITEAAYPGNIGFQEMVEFYQIASRNQVRQLERFIVNEDWEGFKRMIKIVLDKDLK